MEWPTWDNLLAAVIKCSHRPARVEGNNLPELRSGLLDGTRGPGANQRRQGHRSMHDVCFKNGWDKQGYSLMFMELGQIPKNDWDALYNLLHKKAQAKQLPLLLPPVTYNSYIRWPMWMFAEYEEHLTMRVLLDKIVGDNWANDQDRASYPKINKLTTILSGMLWKAPALGKRSIPPVPLIQINGEYYAQEGNHRIYAARLLGRKTIKAKVRLVKYNEMLAQAELVNVAGMPYLLIKKDDGIKHFELEPYEVERLIELGVKEGTIYEGKGYY